MNQTDIMEEEKGGQEVVGVAEEEDPGKGFIGTDLTCLPHPLMWQTQLVCRSFRRG